MAVVAGCCTAGAAGVEVAVEVAGVAADCGKMGRSAAAIASRVMNSRCPAAMRVGEKGHGCGRQNEQHVSLELAW